MTARWPSSCVYAASSISIRQHGRRRLIASSAPLLIRPYAQKSSSARQRSGVAPPQSDPVKSALEIVETNAEHDPVNPPRSTLPPPLKVPSRGSEPTLTYWWRIGRAYGVFYWLGVKAVWFNYKASKLLKERITKDGQAKDITDAVAKGLLTRSEFQLLARNSHDIGKLPFFGLLALVFGEWLVFIVPFIPNTVPGTCRIPKQVLRMREKAEERRRISFRQGIAEPSAEQLPEDEIDSAGQRKDVTSSWPLAFSDDYCQMMLKNFRDDQLFHISAVLGLHSRVWDRIQLPPPSFLLRRAIRKRFRYIAQDDLLILQGGGAARLAPDELHIACEQRGLDIIGKRDGALRESLDWWLKRQEEDAGWGKAMLAMLFRRPNVWSDIRTKPSKRTER